MLASSREIIKGFIRFHVRCFTGLAILYLSYLLDVTCLSLLRPRGGTHQDVDSVWSLGRTGYLWSIELILRFW